MQMATTLLMAIATGACHVTSQAPSLSGTKSISPPRPIVAAQANKTHMERSRNPSWKIGNCMNGLCQNPHRRLSPSALSARSRSHTKPPMRPLATETRPASLKKIAPWRTTTGSLDVPFRRIELRAFPPGVGSV